jgi:hypothetical protein
MAYLAEATAERLRALARSVTRHRSGGGVLDDLPAAERDLLQAMNEEQRDFFLAELARAQAQEGGAASRSGWVSKRARHAAGEGSDSVEGEPTPSRRRTD